MSSARQSLTKYRNALRALALLLVVAAGAVANEVRCEMVNPSAVEAEPAFNQLGESGQVRITRTAPLFALHVVVGIAGSATPSYTGVPAGTADYDLVKIDPDGTQTVLSPTLLPNGEYTVSVFVPYQQESVLLEIRPIDDAFLEGGEDAVIQVKRDSDANDDDDTDNNGLGDGNAFNDYIVFDLSGKLINITDADVAVSIQALDPRADEYISNAGSGSQPFNSQTGLFRVEVDFSATAAPATSVPTRRQLTLSRGGKALNSWEDATLYQGRLPDYDVVMLDSPPGAQAPADYVVGWTEPGGKSLNEEPGSVDIELFSGYDPDVDFAMAGFPPPFSVGDVVAFQFTPGFYLVTGVTGAEYEVVDGVIVFVRPSYITVTPPIRGFLTGDGTGNNPEPGWNPTTGAANTSTGNPPAGFAIYRIGNTVTTDVSDRRLAYNLPYGTPPAQLRYYLLVIPYNDYTPEGVEDVTMTVISSNDFVLRTPEKDSVLISDDDSVADIQRISDAIEGGDPGIARITLTQSIPQPVTIQYTISGTATNTTDYATLTGEVTIPAFFTEADISIAAARDSFAESENVVLSLSESLSFLLRGSGSGGSNPTSTIQIFDFETIATVPSASVQLVVQPGEPDTIGAVQITLNQASTNVLIMNLTISGTAGNGVDYQTIGSTVTMAAGTTTVLVPIVPIDDTLPEGPETINIGLASGSGYRINTAASVVTTRMLDDETSGSGGSGGDGSGNVQQNKDGGGCGLGGSAAGFLLLGLFLVLRFRSKQ